MQTIWRAAITALIVLMLAGCSQGRLENNDGPRLIVLIRNEDMVSLEAVDPRDGSRDILSEFSVADPEGEGWVHTQDIYLAPDLKHAALVVHRPNPDVWVPDALYLYDIAADETLEISPANPGRGYFEAIHEVLLFSWSPDSRMLAYVGFDENRQIDVFLYQVENRTTLRLTEDQWVERDLYWSPLGQRLAFVSSADGRTVSNDILEVIEVATLQKSTVATLDGLDESYPGPGSWAICDLEWSPSGAYIALVSSCIFAGLPYFTELMVAAVPGTGEPVVVTGLTHDAATETLINSIAHYWYAWTPGDQLLIGHLQEVHPYAVVDGLPLGPTSEGLSVFDTTSRSLTSIEGMPTGVIPPVAWNAQERVFAWRVIGGNNSATMQIAQLTEDNRLVNSEITLPDGCHPQWSPDGQYLAYMPQQPSELTLRYYSCGENGTGTSLLIYSIETNDIVEVLAEEGQLRLIGWEDRSE